MMLMQDLSIPFSRLTLSLAALTLLVSLSAILRTDTVYAAQCQVPPITYLTPSNIKSISV